MSIYSNNYSSTETQFNSITGEEYYICNNCNSINVVSGARKKNKDRKVLWEIKVEKGIKRMFKILAATLDMDQEECLLYLLHLQEKEKKGQLQDIGIAGGFYEEKGKK